MVLFTNYHTTLFLKRATHAVDKRLWASEPVWWGQKHPSARSCLLRFLQIAKEMQDCKCQLRREAVPRTATGYVINAYPQQTQAPLVKRLRSQAHATITLNASSTNGKGREFGHKPQPQARSSSLSAESGSSATLMPCMMLLVSHYVAKVAESHLMV